jgi:hypothetical protein
MFLLVFILEKNEYKKKIYAMNKFCAQHIFNDLKNLCNTQQSLIQLIFKLCSLKIF